MNTSSSSSSSYRSCIPESVDPEFSDPSSNSSYRSANSTMLSSVDSSDPSNISSSDPQSSSSSSAAGPPVPVDPSTPPRLYRKSTDVIPASPGENYPEPPKMDPEFLDIWYEENYFKADAHDNAQIQLQELVAEYIHGYRADEVYPLETLISVLDAHIEEMNAKLNEFGVDVGEPTSSRVIPSGKKGAFNVIEQNKKLLRKANDEIHRLREHIAHLDQDLTNAIDRDRDFPGPSFTSSPRQMNANELQVSMESQSGAIARLAQEDEVLQAKLDDLNTFVRKAREYVLTQEVEVGRLKDEIMDLHEYTGQLKQQGEGVAQSTSRSFSIPSSTSGRDSRLGGTFNQPPLNRTSQAPPGPALANASSGGQNQIPQSSIRHSYPPRSRPNKIRNDDMFGRSIGRISNSYDIGSGFNMSTAVTGSPRNLTQNTTMDSLAPNVRASRMSDAPMKLNTTVKISPRSTGRSSRTRSGDN